ncbi:MAG TPA: alpha/beta fold hydrolase [Oculatellaceae cyanobacterium]|jgi:alpha-beta hydrolase superfamily lysophospholipase
MFVVNDYLGADGHPMRYGEVLNPNQPSTGKAMLFIPGLGGSVKAALDFLEGVSSAYSPIYGADLRGFGLNPTEHPLHHPDVILEDLDAFYRSVIAPCGYTDLTLCGLSLGGVLATLLAARYPKRFNRLILFAPAYKPHARSFSLGYVIRNILAHLILGKKARTRLPYGIAQITRNDRILNDPQYNILEPLVLTPGFLLGVRELCNQAMVEVGNITIPTLMVIPGQDMVCDPDAMQKAFDRIPGTTPKKCLHYADFYHDVLMETGHTAIIDEVLAWSDTSQSYTASSSS